MTHFLSEYKSLSMRIGVSAIGKIDKESDTGDIFTKTCKGVVRVWGYGGVFILNNNDIFKIPVL